MGSADAPLIMVEMASQADRDKQHTEMAIILPEVVSGLRKTDEAIARLAAQQEKTGAILDHIWQDLKGHGDRLSSVEKDITTGRLTRWDNIWQAAGVALVIGGFFWALLTGQINDNYEQFREHAKEGNHPGAVIEKIGALQDRLDVQIGASEKSFKEAEARHEKLYERIEDRVQNLERRTGTLFKDGQPY